jgi:peroxisomal 3,2-trans-enoyl-CoA isomerase
MTFVKLLNVSQTNHLVHTCTMLGEAVSIEYCDSIAIITLDKPQKLNSLTKDEFYNLATLLREADARPNVVVTLLIGKGRFFSA